MERLAACLKYCELKKEKRPDYTKYVGIWLAIHANRK